MTFTPSKKELNMGTDNFSTQAFEAWLKIDKNESLLKRIAGKTYRKMEMKKLNLPGMDIHLTAPDEDILQELKIFLLKNEKVRKDLLAGSPKILNQLQTYLWHRMLDISRSAEGNQDINKDIRRLLYRHIMDVMGNSDKFVKTKKPSREIVFGLTHALPRTIVMIEDIIGIEDRHDMMKKFNERIAYPQDLPKYFQAFNTKKNILKLAEYFWEQAIKKTREPNIQISVSEFISWIGEHVNLSNKTKPYAETYDDETPTEFQAKYLKKASNEQEDTFKKKYLIVWANNFYYLLKDGEKKVFYYYECKELKHKDVAELMGKKGNLSYRRDKIRDNLKAFLRPLEWVSPDNGRKRNDPADFIFFRDTLCKLLNAAIERAVEAV